MKLRYRHDGLTPERQVALVRALAECGCVREACARIGVSTEAFYRLRRRPDAQSFRLACDAALDGAADCIEDAAFGRAVNGVEVPHYYKGELVGTHRRYDERLAMFLLRYRKPHRYGKACDRVGRVPHPERTALGMADMLAWVALDARRDAAGVRRQVATELARDGDDEPWRTNNLFLWGPAADAVEPEEDVEDPDDDDFDPDPDRFSPDVPSTTSTSGPARNRRMRRKASARARKR